jgi:hypothetical protein
MLSLGSGKAYCTSASSRCCQSQLIGTSNTDHIINIPPAPTYASLQEISVYRRQKHGNGIHDKEPLYKQLSVDCIPEERIEQEIT